MPPSRKPPWAFSARHLSMDESFHSSESRMISLCSPVTEMRLQHRWRPLGGHHGQGGGKNVSGVLVSRDRYRHVFTTAYNDVIPGPTRKLAEGLIVAACLDVSREMKHDRFFHRSLDITSFAGCHLSIWVQCSKGQNRGNSHFNCFFWDGLRQIFGFKDLRFSALYFLGYVSSAWPKLFRCLADKVGSRTCVDCPTKAKVSRRLPWAGKPRSHGLGSRDN